MVAFLRATPVLHLVHNFHFGFGFGFNLEMTGVVYNNVRSFLYTFLCFTEFLTKIHNTHDYKLILIPNTKIINQFFKMNGIHIKYTINHILYLDY